MWSDASVASAWVQDEAAEGRDSGRLVPVALGGAGPRSVSGSSIRSRSVNGTGAGNRRAWAK